MSLVITEACTNIVLFSMMTTLIAHDTLSLLGVLCVLLRFRLTATLLRAIHDDFNFVELLRDLIMIARMIRPHLGSRLVSARLTFGVHCCTLPREERCGRRTNPVKSTCTSTTPQLSERAGADARLSTLHSKIDPSELAAKGVLRARRLCCLRRETAFSPESAAGTSEAGSY